MRDFPFAIVGFDLDGTLLDTEADLGVALNRTLALAGRPQVPAGHVRALIGGGGRLMLKRALDLSGGTDDAELAALHAEFLVFYQADIAVNSRLFSGGEAMLDALAARGVALAVVTNKLESLAVELLARLGLSDRFYTVIGGDTLGKGHAKPSPDLLLEMIRRGGGGRAAFVGDTTFDTRAAHAAGIPCVAVRFGFHDIVPEDLGGDRLISHFDELIPALESLG